MNFSQVENKSFTFSIGLIDLIDLVHDSYAYISKFSIHKISNKIQDRAMEKYHGFDQAFYEFLFGYVIENGGVRMQVIASDLGNFFHLCSQLSAKQLPNQRST